MLRHNHHNVTEGILETSYIMQQESILKLVCRDFGVLEGVDGIMLSH
jgi:hypothetical protein